MIFGSQIRGHHPSGASRGVTDFYQLDCHYLAIISDIGRLDDDDGGTPIAPC